MSNTQERLIECFRVVFPNLTTDEIVRASTTSVATWDSLATITLISIIEEQFGIMIGPEEYDYFISFELISDSLKGKTVNA